MKKSVLIVEDEFVIERLLQLTLEPDFILHSAYDGQDALEKISKLDVDMIILDLMIPKIDGYTVLEKLKSNSETKKIPVLVLSAKHMRADIERAIRLGAEEYITKPFEPEFLRNRIKTLLEIKDNRLLSKGQFFEFGNTLNYVQQIIKHN